MRLLLIRHGQTIDNVHGELGTVIPGPGLTELGHRQASAVPEALEHENIEAIYISTMLRTRLTAGPLAAARGLTPVVLEGIHEINAGDLEGRSDKEALHGYMGTIFSWWQSLDGRIPGGEDGNEFYERFNGAIGRVAAAHKGTVAVVSHGAAIRTWASWISRNIDAEFSRTHDLSNTAVVAMEGSPEGGWVTTHWAEEPVGGALLEDTTAPDPTGEALVD